MKISTATSMAEELMTKHGVGRLPFRLVHNPKQPQLLGHVPYVIPNPHVDLILPTAIHLDREWVKHLDEDKVKTVILHEIAHAQVIKNKATLGHGPAWVRACYRLGIQPKVTYTGSDEDLPRSMRRIGPNSYW